MDQGRRLKNMLVDAMRVLTLAKTQRSKITFGTEDMPSVYVVQIDAPYNTELGQSCFLRDYLLTPNSHEYCKEHC